MQGRAGPHGRSDGLIGKAAAGANSDITSYRVSPRSIRGPGRHGGEDTLGCASALGLGNVDNTSDATKALPGNPIGEARIGGDSANGA